MDNLERTLRNIQEAINFETLLACTRRSQSFVEPLFDRIGEVVPLKDPMTLHPNTYSEAIGIDTREMLDTHSFVKSRFFRLDHTDFVIKRGDRLYPQHAADVQDSPRFLYGRGNIELLGEKCVCIVGTRNPSNEGKEYAKKTVETLGSHGVVIVSGLALGIDGIAHISALATKTPTVAVLGTPLIDVYPPEHRNLQKVIAEHGLVITRFSPAVQTQKWHFLLRNRLMSSLAVGSVVVEDRDGGGAVKQAIYALEQQRRVVIFQHVLDNRSLLWPRRLSLKPGVMVVKRPEYIHARLFAKPRADVEDPSKVAVPAQLSLFDLA
jgi:DNA processing protein